MCHCIETLAGFGMLLAGFIFLHIEQIKVSKIKIHFPNWGGK